MNMDFGANKILLEVIKESAFGGTYFRDIYSEVNVTWKEFDDLKNIDLKYYYSNYYDDIVNKCCVKCET